MNLKITTLLFLLLVALAPQTSYACRCIQSAFTPDASHENIANADLIFDGRVVEMLQFPQGHEKGGQTKIILQSNKVLKGDLKESEIVIERHLHSCDWVSLNTSFFMMKKTDTGAYDFANGCSVYVADSDVKKLKTGSYRAP